MEREQLTAVVEAMILVTEEPITLSSMALILEPDGIQKADIESVINDIKVKRESDPASGVILAEVAGGYQFRTRPDTAAFIQRMNIPKPTKLSQAALETLAIVAYRQPLVRAEIEEIRGVDSGGVLKTLLERNLIRVIGKRDEPGSPMIYATTSKFLEMFNLGSLKELPTLREYEELEKEHFGHKDNSDLENGLLDGLASAPFEQKWSSEDGNMLGDLEEGVKQLRRLEKEIFPKPVEQLIAVPNELQPNDGSTTSTETVNATSTSEDSGSGN